MDNRDELRGSESGKSLKAARLDDNDDLQKDFIVQKLTNKKLHHLWNQK